VVCRNVRLRRLSEGWHRKPARCREISPEKEQMDVSDAARADLSALLRSLCDKLGVEDRKDELGREADRHLQAMRDAFMKLIRFGKNDVFVRYLLDQLEKNAAIFTDAASKDLLRVSEHQFGSAQFILDAFGAGNKVLRYTWKINPAQRLFEDRGWRRHFELTSSMAMAGSLEIRTIFIAENRHEFDAANVRKVLEFYACQEGMSAKIVSAADWDACMVDQGMSSACIDFGIYGDALLFTAETYAPVDIGSWSKSPADIKRFTRFFDAVWNEPAAMVSYSSASAQKVVLSQLMNADSTFERRQNVVHETVARLEERIRPEVA
jgi:hypothetical protein